MKQVICPKCGKTFSFDESRYDASCNISFICPACRKRFLMTLPEIDACHKNDIDTSLGFITVLENAFGYRQEFPLHAGDNIIGRASKGTEVDIPIETSDMSMDRRHCIINVKRNQQGKLIYTLRDAPSLTGTFLKNELLGEKDRIRIEDGAIITIGATSLILREAE